MCQESQLVVGQPVGYLQSVAKKLNSGLPTTNPASGRVEDLNLVPPDFKSSALNHSPTPPPYNKNEQLKIDQA